MKNKFLIIVCLGFVFLNSCERKEVAKITTTTLCDGIVGGAYRQELTAAGTSPITWTLANGKLPDGLTLSKNGTISGTPTIKGIFEFTVQATNKAGNDTKKISITITALEEQEVKITTITLPNGMVGSAYNQQLTATGATPTTWTLLDGGFPNGLTLSTDGTISGKPTIEGKFDFTVQATNKAGSDAKTLSITVNTVEPFLTVEERFIMLEATGNKDFITVKCNGNWTAIVENAGNKSWCTLGNSSGFGDDKITVNAAQNTGDLMRVAVVKIVSGNFTKSVLIGQNLKVIKQNIDCGWDYPIKPGTPEWKELQSHAAMVAVCQIPEDTLNHLSTECLTKISLQYPLIGNIYAFSMRDGFNDFYNSFNGIRELYKREKVLTYLLKEYHNLINGMSILDGSASDLEKGHFILSVGILEILLYGYSQKVETSEDNYKNALRYLTIGYEKQLKYEDDFRSAFSKNLFARSNILIKIDPALSEIFEGGGIYILHSGMITNTNVHLINTIDSLSYNLIK